MDGKYNIRVFINKPKSATEGEEPSGQVQARVRWKQYEVCFTVGCYANPSKWNLAGQCAMNKTIHRHNGIPMTAISINNLVNKTKDAVKLCFTRFFVENIIPTKEELQNAVIIELSGDEITANERRKKAKMSPALKTDMTIYDYFDLYTDEGTKIKFWSINMIEKVKTLMNHWKEFDPERTLRPKDITEDIMMKFQAHLVEKGLRNGSTNKLIKSTRHFFIFCKKKGAGVREEVYNFNGTLTDVRDKEIVFLTWNEFNQLYCYTIPDNKRYLQTVKDMFIFSCTTGLRYSDIAALQRSNIINDVITVVTEKTDHLLKINLNRFSREIIEKHKLFPPKKGKALPVISNQKCNEYIKELCQLAGIDSLVTIAYRKGNKTFKELKPKYAAITFHSGRRTFVSLALKLGATPEEVKRITGHHSYKMMQRYMAQDEEQRIHATAVFDIRSERDELMKTINKYSNEQLRNLISLMNQTTNII